MKVEQGEIQVTGPLLDGAPVRMHATFDGAVYETSAVWPLLDVQSTPDLAEGLLLAGAIMAARSGFSGSWHLPSRNRGRP